MRSDTPLPRRRHRWLARLAAFGALVGGVLLLSGQIRVVAGPHANPDEGEAGRGRLSAPPDAESLASGYERHDANARTLAFVAALMFGAIAVAIGGMFALVAAFHRADTPTQVLSALQTATITPPGPQLEANPSAELRAFRKREQARLETYGWTDTAHTRARIPIARAMALAVGHGLDSAP